MTLVSYDTETEPFAPGLQFPPLVCGQFAIGKKVSVQLRDEAIDTIEALLLDDRVTLIGHTIAFDLIVAANERSALLPLVFAKYDKCLVLDVSVRQKLLDIATGDRSINSYSLDDLSRRYGFGKLDKGDDSFRTRFIELRNTPVDQWPQRAFSYASTDALIVHSIYRAQDACDYANVLGAEQFRQSAYCLWIKLMSGWGITTDPFGVAAFKAGLEKEYEEIGEYLRGEGLLRPDKVIKSGPRKGLVVPGARDTKATKARMGALIRDMSRADLERGGFVTATGEVSLNKKVLREIEDPVLVAYADFSSLKKQISTDVPLLSHRTIHSYFDTLKETGRVGSSNPNIMNLPRKVGVRECFIPRPGCCFVSADYGGVELFTWAEVCMHLFGYSTLGDELKAGVDPHLKIAADILHKPYDWCKANKKAVDLERQTGKVLNFGCPGGIGAERLVFQADSQYGVKLTEDEAKRLRDMWWSTRTEMRDYSNYIARITDTGGVLEHVYSGRVRGGCSYTEACNSLFQGLASEIFKSAGHEIARACYVNEESPLFGCRIVNGIHDEFILEVPMGPGGRQHEAALELARLMTDAAKLWLRHVPPPKVEVDAMLRWSKKVVALYEDGRLVPWVRSERVDEGRIAHYGLASDGQEKEMS